MQLLSVVIFFSEVFSNLTTTCRFTFDTSKSPAVAINLRLWKNPKCGSESAELRLHVLISAKRRWHDIDEIRSPTCFDPPPKGEYVIVPVSLLGYFQLSYLRERLTALILICSQTIRSITAPYIKTFPPCNESLGDFLDLSYPSLFILMKKCDTSESCRVRRMDDFWPRMLAIHLVLQITRTGG